MPSTYPSSRSRCSKATHWTAERGLPASMPTRATFVGGCASTASGAVRMLSTHHSDKRSPVHYCRILVGPDEYRLRDGESECFAVLRLMMSSNFVAVTPYMGETGG